MAAATGQLPVGGHALVAHMPHGHAGQSALALGPGPAGPPKRPVERGQEPEGKRQKLAGTPGGNKATGEVLQRLPVICNGLRGILLVGANRVICECSECIGRPEPERDYSCTQFEQASLVASKRLGHAWGHSWPTVHSYKGLASLSWSSL